MSVARSPHQIIGRETSHPRKNRATDRELRRLGILLAAARIFNIKGYGGATLDQIATELGISKPTIYLYFGSKEQILLECAARAVDLLMTPDCAEPVECQTGLERLRRFLLRYSEAAVGDFGKCAIRTGDELLSIEGGVRFRALKREIDETLYRHIEAAIGDGSIAAVDARILALNVSGALNWLSRWYDHAGEMPLAMLADEMIKVLINGLKPRQPADIPI
jgi:AcrR family transcriptional regulator